MCPTNGSETVLNTNALTGPSGSHERSVSPPPLPCTITGPRSTGDGNSSTMKSSNRSIPIALAADPTITGASLARAKPSFAPLTMCSSGSVPTSRYSSIRSSSDSATASISFSRAGSAMWWISSGHSDSSAFGPLGYRSAFSCRRSATPRNSCSAPIGSSKGATWFPNAETSWASVPWKSARSRSSLFTKIARGRPASTASSHAASVCTSTPSTAETTTITASAARIAERRSPTKSA